MPYHSALCWNTTCKAAIWVVKRTILYIVQRELESQDRILQKRSSEIKWAMLIAGRSWISADNKSGTHGSCHFLHLKCISELGGGRMARVSRIRTSNGGGRRNIERNSRFAFSCLRCMIFLWRHWTGCIGYIPIHLKKWFYVASLLPSANAPEPLIRVEFRTLATNLHKAPNNLGIERTFI